MLVYYDWISYKAIEIYIILVLLPYNSTCLIQPLDISIFKPFKTILKQTMENFVIDKSGTALLKKDALAIASEAQEEVIFMKKMNIVAEF